MFLGCDMGFKLIIALSIFFLLLGCKYPVYNHYCSLVLDKTLMVSITNLYIETCLYDRQQRCPHQRSLPLSCPLQIPRVQGR